MSGEGMSLNPEERVALAQLLLARHADRLAEDALLWEDLPNLGEFTFEALVEQVAEEARGVWAALRETERATGVDARLLLERAS